MKKIIYLTLLLVFVFSFNSFAQFEGTWGVGAHIGYGDAIKSPSTGAHLHYYYTNQIRIVPNFNIYLPHKNKTMWDINSDIHYIVPLSWEISLYPIGGLSFSNWKYNPSQAENYFSGWTKQRLGLNAGIGLQYDIRYKIRTNFEIKYQAIKDFSQVMVNLGIGFWI